MAVLRILGIDPGSRYMGYGVIERSGSRLRYVHAGRLSLGDMPFTERLLKIDAFLGEFLALYEPDCAAFEGIFHQKYADAAIKLGFGKNGLGVAQSEQTYSSANSDDLKKKLEYIKTPATINWEEKAAAISANSGGTRVSQPIKPAPQRQVSRTEEKTSSAAEIPFYEHDGNKMMKDDAAGHSISFRDKYARDDYSSARPVSEQPKETFRERESFSEGGFNSAGSEKKVAEEGAVSGSRAVQGQTEHTESGRFSENRTSGRTRSFFEEIKSEETKPAEEKAEEKSQAML